MRFYFTLVCSLLLLPFTSDAQAPIEFIQNKGQWDGDFEYRGSTTRGDVFLQKDGFTYLVSESSNRDKLDELHHGSLKSATLRYHAYKVTFEGASYATIKGSKEQGGYYNYFLGNDPKRWQSNIHPYQNIDYKGLYKNIDLHVTSENGNMMYDFIVQPGGDASQIHMRYNGAERLSLKKGNLVVSTSLGDMTELEPYVYQYVNNERIKVNCKYRLEDNVVTFSLPDGYNKALPLVIDPTVVFCTFTGSTADNWGFTATYDDMGNLYAGGLVSGTGFPVSTGAFQVTYGGGSPFTNSPYPCDMGIIKFNSAGNQRLWATYIGGNDNEQPHSMVVDKDTNLIIVGRTYSADYPVTPGAFDGSQNTPIGSPTPTSDIVVTKLNPAGAALIASTFIGGTDNDGVNYDADESIGGNLKHNYGDDARSEVLVDKTGNIYVASSTMSSNFPFTSGSATQTTLKGIQDGVVFKFNPTLTNLLWSTYLGGSNDDAAYVLAFNNAQTSLYVGGGTMSNDFPVTAGTLWPTFRGSTDGFLLKFQNSGAYPMQRGTFIGTPDYDQCYGVQVDVNDDVYTMGQTVGGTFPVTPGTYNNPGSGQFIMKMDNTLTNNLISTVIGSGNSTRADISPVAFLVDTCENVYMSGWSGNLNFPFPSNSCVGMPITPNALQSTTDGVDFYFICLNKNMQNILYGTFFGRNSTAIGKGEHVDGGTSRFDKNGVIYQAICGGCNGSSNAPVTAFPTTAGSWSPLNAFPANCNEAVVKIDFQLGPVTARATASPSTRGCAPFTVQFTNTSYNGVSFVWDFGDNTPTTTQNSPTHTFSSYGIYAVKLKATNSNACIKVLDSVILIIRVDTARIKPSFTYQVNDSCAPYPVTFTNTSQYSGTPGSTAFTVFEWDFGDGTTYTGTTPPTHTYTTDGNYNVKLKMIDTSACNSPDSVTIPLSLSSIVIGASFTVEDTVCKGAEVTFNNTTANGDTYDWNFGDGKTSNSKTVTHVFDSAGIYTVRMISRNPKACREFDTTFKTIVVQETPTADFDWHPFPPRTNIPITFTNLSTNALTYEWEFGDGEKSTEVNPVHEYKKTSIFSACLISHNLSNCPARTCKDVPTDIVSLADLPTGFSPNGDGANDVLYVRGANIQTMDLKIYNRWGQLVFESTDQHIGWDGTYNGKPQEMEAYAFVLEVKFWDGGSLQKQGNVTLLR